jgi:hypothetical protein
VILLRSKKHLSFSPFNCLIVCIEKNQRIERLQFSFRGFTIKIETLRGFV